MTTMPAITIVTVLLVASKVDSARAAERYAYALREQDAGRLIAAYEAIREAVDAAPDVDRYLEAKREILRAAIHTYVELGCEAHEAGADGLAEESQRLRDEAREFQLAMGLSDVTLEDCMPPGGSRALLACEDGMRSAIATGDAEVIHFRLRACESLREDIADHERNRLEFAIHQGRIEIREIAERLILKAHRAHAAGDSDRAHALLTEAHAIAPGDRVLQAQLERAVKEFAARSRPLRSLDLLDRTIRGIPPEMEFHCRGCPPSAPMWQAF